MYRDEYGIHIGGRSVTSMRSTSQYKPKAGASRVLSPLRCPRVHCGLRRTAARPGWCGCSEATLILWCAWRAPLRAFGTQTVRLANQCGELVACPPRGGYTKSIIPRDCMPAADERANCRSEVLLPGRETMPARTVVVHDDAEFADALGRETRQGCALVHRSGRRAQRSGNCQNHCVSDHSPAIQRIPAVGLSLARLARLARPDVRACSPAFRNTGITPADWVSSLQSRSMQPMSEWLSNG